MNKNKINQLDQIRDYDWLGIASLLFTFAWAFQDEGQYSFAWMKDLGSWISILIYGSFVFLIFLTFSII